MARRSDEWIARDRALTTVSIAAGVGTLLLAFGTTTAPVQRVDDTVERRIGPHRPRLLRAARVGTLPGEPFLHPIIGAAAALTILAFRRGHPRRVLLPLGSASLGAILSHHAIKLVYSRRRPVVALRRGKYEPAYPSGHTTDSTAVLSTCTHLLVREGVVDAGLAAPIAVMLAGITGASRVALGWHWASDVAGGWLCGLAVGATCMRQYERLRHH